MNAIVVTKKDIVSSSGNNVFKYDFRNSVDLRNKEIALSSITLYYSWFNITSDIGNNTFTYTWRVNTTETPYTITLPDGLYTPSDINAYMQKTFIANGHYIINSTTGDYVYYAEFIHNNTLNSVDIITHPVPDALPAGYTEPTNFDGWPDDYYNPVITLTADFNEFMGYTAGYATSDNYGIGTKLSYNSSTSPDFNVNETILITIQQVQNEYTFPYGVVYAFTVTNESATQIIIEQPSFPIFSPLIGGYYDNLYIRLLKSSDYTPITIDDPNITMIFAIKDKNVQIES